MSILKDKVLSIAPFSKGTFSANTTMEKGKFWEQLLAIIGRKSYFSFVILLVSIVAYFCFGYIYQRNDFVILFGLYSLLFVCFGILYKLHQNNFKFLLVAAIIFRFVLLFAFPNLSQDFYRFIWDGRLLLQGYNPYLFTPNELMEIESFSIPQSSILANGMGALSAGNHTNYPPVNQLSFALANIFTTNNLMGAVLGMRIQLIFADLGVIWIGRKILTHLKFSPSLIFLYALNPFVIIELTGNLHYEGLMVFFFILGMYLLILNKWKTAAFFIGIAVAVKLIPLIFLPLFFQRFPWKKLLGFYTIVLGTVLLSFLPFFSMEFVNNYFNTVGLWFQNFEFNASLYYVAREIGYQLTGYNQIAVIGKVLPILILAVVLYFAFFKNNKNLQDLFTNMLLVIAAYYLLSTTVHPWYLTTLLVLLPFTAFRFPIIWSFLVFLSYNSYSNEIFQERYVLLVIQYGLVLGFYIWEKNGRFLKKRALF